MPTTREMNAQAMRKMTTRTATTIMKAMVGMKGAHTTWMMVWACTTTEVSLCLHRDTADTKYYLNEATPPFFPPPSPRESTLNPTSTTPAIASACTAASTSTGGAAGTTSPQTALTNLRESSQAQISGHRGASTPTDTPLSVSTAADPTSVTISTHSPTIPFECATATASTPAVASASANTDVSTTPLSEPLPEPSEGTRRQRRRKADLLQLNACTCGVTITDPEIQEGKGIMNCSTPGCETVWVSDPLICRHLRVGLVPMLTSSLLVSSSLYGL